MARPARYGAPSRLRLFVWAGHAADFRLLAKVAFLAEAERATQQGELAEGDRQFLRQYVGTGPNLPVKAPALAASAPATPVAVTQFNLGGAAWLFTLQAGGGRVILYTPSAAPAFHGFADHRAMLKWVTRRLQGAGGQAWVQADLRPAHREPVRPRGVCRTAGQPSLAGTLVSGCRMVAPLSPWPGIAKPRRGR
ncbi:dermonecrotic toxin domain-containing protein [Pseudomonas typographi]|uniref:dermonecrotic toxin domain-containing protein n=1 Tax=Pseudomonas typographi TaxID=2715964 RepID=UPI003B8304A5